MMIAGNKPDIMLLTEVIPKGQRFPLSMALLRITGYSLHLSFDHTKENLGRSGERGVCVFVRDDILTSAIPISDPASRFREQLWLQLKLRDNKILIVGCIYRSPSYTTHNNVVYLEHLFRAICDLAPTHLLITGDFNFPLIDWDTEYCSAPEGHPSHKFVKIVQDSFLFQHVKRPTRYRLGETSNILDLVFSNEEGMVRNMEYLPGLGKSDHVTLRFTLKCSSVSTEQGKPKLNFYRANFTLLRQMLCNTDWTAMAHLDLEDCYQFFKNTIDSLTDACIPYNKSRRKFRNIYMTSEAGRLKDKKNTLWRIYTNTKDDLDHVRFTQCRNRLRSLTRRLLTSHQQTILGSIKDNPKSTWQYIHSRLNTRVGLADLRDDNTGCLETKDKEKAELLNSCFSSAFTSEDTSNVPYLGLRWQGEVLDDIVLSTDLVLAKLLNLKQTSSPGPDNIHPRVLREVANEICHPLSILFRKSIDVGVLPQEWKLGSVVPIFKKGDRHRPENYRPVSLTAIPCKVLESLIKDKLMEHLLSHDLLSKDQHGFRPKRSCDTQMLEVIEDWSRVLEEKSPLDAVYLDYRKAFDSVPHERLLHKLWCYGVRGKLLKWIRAFLTFRKQQVIVGSSASNWAAVTSGVPQGSVLGPLLFVIFINDLPDHIRSSVKIFADDTKLYYPASTPDYTQILQRDIHAVVEWSSQWQLPFNTSKCSVLHVGHSNPGFTYTMAGSIISESDAEKDLGVWTDCDLKFHEQAATAVSRASRVLAMVRKSFTAINITSLPLLYKSLVRPILEYGNITWGPFNRRDQQAVERVQRRATRLVPTLRNLGYVDRLRALDLPSLYHRRRRGDMIRVFQILRGYIDLDPEQFFTIATHSRTRGHSWKLAKPVAVSRVRRNCFSVRIVTDWNSLPAAVVESTTTNQFKSRLDAHWALQKYDIPNQD